MAVAGKLRWLGIGSLWMYRVLTWAVLLAGLAFAAIVMVLRYWILPDIGNYREDIARIVSERARQKVTIEKIQANWEGLRPQLKLENVTVYDAAGRPAIRLPRMDQTLSWLSLALFELRFHALDIYQPTLQIRRDANGAISVGGVELSGDGSDTGFTDWLLRQRDIEVHEATLIWNDELRKAPQLELRNVSLQMYNQRNRHRFGLRAVPPGELASPLDVRGELLGQSIKTLADLNGRLYLRLDYADIAAWRAWVPFPVEFPRGSGAVRAWLSFSQHQLTDVIADVRLANVLTRLAPDLPELDLANLAGRIGWKQSDAGFEITTSRLGLTTSGGLILHPADFLLRITAAGTIRQGRGEMHADALELAPLTALADHLPLAPEARRQLAIYSPKGALNDMVVRWTGDWRQPQQYSIRGRFEDLSLKHAGDIPAFSGVSGAVEGNERGGTLSLNTRKTSVTMPLVFRDPIEFESLAAQIAWVRSGGQTELRLNNISFSNAHLAGTVFGNYRTAVSGPGSIDLTGNLTRADARFVSRYVPLVVGKGARDWLDAAFIAGRSESVTLRLKGNLDEFPFADGKGGVFQVTVKVAGGVLHYWNGWPDIENMTGDVIFSGKRMDVQAQSGTIYGTRLGKVHAEIPDLRSAEKVLSINGEADGPTGDFISFIEKTPVLEWVDHFTEGWRAQGNGKLSLKLLLPLYDGAKTRVAGSFQFSGNTVVIKPGMPGFEQAGGRIEFTDSGTRAQNVNGVLLGGPVTMTAVSSSEAGGRITLQGRINTDSARKAGGPPWTQSLRGAADWNAAVNMRTGNVSVLIESSLQGLAVELPAPITKTAAESMPLKISGTMERQQPGAKPDRWSLSLGDIISMNLVSRREGAQSVIARGNVRFGGTAAEADRNGVWVSGSIKALDVNRWFALSEQGGGDVRFEWGGVDLKLGAMDFFQRRFTDLGVSAAVQGGQWRVAFSGKELDGNLTWLPQGRGKVVARMNTLAIPAPSPAIMQSLGQGVQRAQKDLDLPALDVIAEQFINKDKQLGRLELNAASEGSEWRIDKMRITNPESTFTLDGAWQPRLMQPRTQVNLKLETSDIGKLLTRLGYPEGVRRGTAKLEGALSWNGAPYDFDYPTLTGNLVLDAAKGQFVKLEPGIGKLLGILSLQALPRRITLDFRDVFSEGFSFDEIVGPVKINRGIASTDNFRIQGPPARIVMSGEVDLAKETQNLKVRITPHVSDSVSIAGALLGGPIAGVAAFIAQKVLKDPLDRAVSYEYGVTGSWSDPKVNRIESRASAPQAQQSTPE